MKTAMLNLPVSIPEKREIPFEETSFFDFLWKKYVSIPEKREIPFEAKLLKPKLLKPKLVSIPEKREIPFEAKML